MTKQGQSNQNIRRVRVGLRAKIFLTFMFVMIGYALISSTYLFRHFYQDKARYVLFSLHQIADSSCSKLSVGSGDPEEMRNELKKIEVANSYVYHAGDQKILSNSLSEQNDPLGFEKNPLILKKFIESRSQGGNLENFTTEYRNDSIRYFLSACKFEQGSAESWLLLAADADVVLQPASGLVMRMLAIFGALLGVGLLIVYFLAKKLTNPLAFLTKAADELGAGNYRASVSIKGSDELGVLSDSFNILSHRLESREAELEKSTEAANQDFLTGLWNRRYLDRRTQEHLALSKRHGRDLAIVYMDADHFKKINDTFGHKAGDDVLIDFGKVAKTHLRESDFLARAGGEEFVIVLPETDLAGALQVAQKVRNVLKAHRFLNEKNVPMTASFGVVSLGSVGPVRNALDLIAKADEYAYKSKTAGRDRITSPEGQIV